VWLAWPDSRINFAGRPSGHCAGRGGKILTDFARPHRGSQNLSDGSRDMRYTACVSHRGKLSEPCAIRLGAFGPDRRGRRGSCGAGRRFSWRLLPPCGPSWVSRCCAAKFRGREPSHPPVASRDGGPGCVCPRPGRSSGFRRVSRAAEPVKKLWISA
jgi:hypothetical protein